MGRVIRSQRDCMLERHLRSQRFHGCGELLRPLLREREDVVGEPEMVGLETVLELQHFLRHQGRGPAVVGVTPDGLGAPVAAIRAAAAGNHIQRKVAVGRMPGAAIGLGIHQVPGGRGQGIEIGDGRAVRGVADAAAVPKRQTANLFRAAAAGVFQQQLRRFHDGGFHFADRHVVEAGGEIFRGVAAGVRPVDDRRHTGAPRGRGHGVGQFAIAQQAHLGEEVEIIFADGHQARPVLRQGQRETRLRRFECGVEDRHPVALPAQRGRRQQGLQRGIGLHFAHLLAVVINVVGMRQEHVNHGVASMATRGKTAP